jgi:predicted esterase
MEKLHGALAMVALIALGACAPRELGPAPSASPEPDREPPGAPRTEELPVQGFRPAVLVVPPGSGPHPVLVAAHGAGDRAEWQCEWWGPLVGARGFVLCPRGRPMSFADVEHGGHYYPDHFALEKEVLAALESLAKVHGAAVDPGPVAYAGYSQGAIMGALFTQKRGGTFARLALIEGGYTEWDVPTARRFKQSGGERVLFACGQRYCERHAKTSVAWLERAGVAARLENAPGGGHSYGGSVGDRVSAALSWWLEGDPRWAD